MKSFRTIPRTVHFSLRPILPRYIPHFLMISPKKLLFSYQFSFSICRRSPVLRHSRSTTIYIHIGEPSQSFSTRTHPQAIYRSLRPTPLQPDEALRCSGPSRLYILPAVFLPLRNPLYRLPAIVLSSCHQCFFFSF